VRSQIKSLLDKVGLLETAESVHRRINRHEITAFAEGARFYLYNHWLTNFPSNAVRLQYLRLVLGIKVGHETFVHMGCYFEGDRISIGDNTVIGRHCHLGGGGGAITIKNNVSITARSYIFGTTHLVDSPTFEAIYRDVVIEDYAWIGAGAMVLPGVHIGRGAVLGATATATKDVPDFAIYAGVPAREVGNRSRDLHYTLRYSPYFG
jgi:acetyltransferase-like isoleucine patch superfamily enzyme